MPFFTKHSAPAVPFADPSLEPDCLERPKIHRFTLKQFRVKNNQNCPKNRSKVSIFRFSRSKCKKDNSAVVDAHLVEQEVMPTNALSRSVSSIHEGRDSSSDLSLETSLSDSCLGEDCCACLLEDSYHPDQVHKKHWYTTKRTQSCKIGCSKRDDKECQRSRKHFKESFTPITRQFRRFLHLNSDNGIHYFFESRDCECYNSPESFETIFGRNNTVCQMREAENNCLSIFSTPPTPIWDEICSSESCCSTDTTLIVVSKLADYCISLGSVFDCAVQDCSSAVPALACEGQDCYSPANVVLSREEQQLSLSDSAIAHDEQCCSTAVDLILSCGAQECSSVISASAGLKQQCSSSVDLVLGCELTECGPVCQALDNTSPNSGKKSTLVLFENRPRLCSTVVPVLSCTGVDGTPRVSCL